LEQRDPISDFEIINRELELYDPELAKRPQIVAGNKIDIPESEENQKRVADYMAEHGYQFFLISAAVGTGIDRLLYAVADLLDAVDQEHPEEVKKLTVKQKPRVKRQPEEITVTKEDDTWVVHGENIERMVVMTDFDNEYAIVHLQKRLKKAGVEDKLIQAGAHEGDNVRIGEMSFEFYPF
jgi:GTP-binding protein